MGTIFGSMTRKSHSDGDVNLIEPQDT